jgi:hypothetical protein
MLRWVMGDDQFFAACRDYLNNPGTAYDFGRVAELQNYMETRSGLDLDEFFADWYYGEGYPSYVLEWEEQQDSVIFTLSQLQSHPSVSFFEMPVPVTISENGNHFTFVLPHTAQFQRFAFFTGDVDIDSVKLDPERWILTRDNIVQEYITGIHDLVNQDYFRTYPNPAHDVLQFEHGEEIASLSLIDAVGKSITIPWDTQKANVSAVPSGSYIARLQNTAGGLIGVVPIVIVQ